METRVTFTTSEGLTMMTMLKWQRLFRADNLCWNEAYKTNTEKLG